MKTCKGVIYTISMDYMFATSPGACAVTIKYPYEDSQGSVTSPDNKTGTKTGQWTTMNSLYQAVSTADMFQVVFTCENGATDTVSIDNVVVTPYREDA